MFRLHRTKAAKSGERIDFKLSHFKAVQVPKGWDKLCVSVISVETGKSIAKLSKAAVRNGTCQWTETLSESVWVSQEESSKELEECFYKFVVSTGSARSGILGEAMVNMASYTTSSAASAPASLPLKKCNYGTTLQVKIQCLTPRMKLRDDDSKETNSHEEDIIADSGDVEIKSEESEDVFPKTARSYSSTDLGSTTHQEERERREAGFSTSDVHHTYDSAENSIERENISPLNKTSIEGSNLTERQDSISSQNSVAQGSHRAGNSSPSSNSSMNSRITHSENLSQDEQQEFATSSLRISSSSKSLLEAAEDTIEDLRGEAKMWERNARKLMLDLDILRKEYLDLSKNQANLNMELTAACAERDGLQKEVEQLKMLSDKSMLKSSALEGSTVQDGDVARLIKELENEIKFQKESNAHLNLQLNRSQESNAELVSVLRELDITVEMQKVEIESFSALQSKFTDMENSIQAKLEENRNLMLQMRQLQESEKNLQAEVQALEQALEENTQTLTDTVTESKSKLSAKEKEIVSLKAKLSESVRERKFGGEVESINGGDRDMMNEIEALKSKLQELENDCQELTDENLELLLQLKEIKKSSEGADLPLVSSRSEVSNHGSQINDLEEKLKKKLLREVENEYNVSVQELESLKLNLEVKVAELGEKSAEIERLEAGLLSKEEEIGSLQSYQRDLETKASLLQKKKDQLEENIELIRRESDIAAKCLNDLQKDFIVLSSSMDSHVSANKILERKSSELESSKHELEVHLSELKQENLELSGHISGLEAQLKHLIDEGDSTKLELQKAKSHAVHLQVEISRSRNELEAQKMDMEQKLKEMHSQWLEAQEECEYLRRANPKLQDTAESLMEECSLLQKSNEELKRQKMELQEHCTNLEAKLNDSHRSFADCSKRVKILEEQISSMLDDSASKEKKLISELDALLQENREQNVKIDLFNQMYMEKIVEVDNLQHEVGKLTKQLSERERTASDTAHEVSGLRAETAKLQSELNARQTEYDMKFQTMMDELAACKQSHELLKVDNGRMSKLLANYKSGEEKFKTNLNGLELKLTVAEYERQQLIEESSGLKVQLLKTGLLQDEVLALKKELSATKLQKEKLETSMHLVSAECKELRVEKDTFIEQITTLQKVVSEYEECKRSRIALHDKLQKMQGDLLAKEALCERDLEIKNELNRMKRTNKQLQKQIQQFEAEKNECITRAQSLEEELILLKEAQQNQRKPNNVDFRSKQYESKDESHPIEDDCDLKIRLLEDELAKANEANNVYKIQIKRLMSEGRKGRMGSPRKSTAEGEVVPRERFERTKSSLETELRDLRERYLNMSLKYAEVEAQREELVMKLKATRNGRKY